jgi:hypothetical protein
VLGCLIANRVLLRLTHVPSSLLMVPQSLMRHSIMASRVPCSTSHSPVWTLLMPSSRSASICMTRGSLISHWSSGFSGTFEALLITVFSSNAPQPLISLLIQTLTGLTAPTLAILCKVSTSSSMTTWYLGVTLRACITRELCRSLHTSELCSWC